jgi:hypothetical protein
MTISETKSTDSYLLGPKWIQLSGTAQEVLDGLSLRGIDNERDVTLLVSGTTTIAIYCMTG